MATLLITSILVGGTAISAYYGRRVYRAIRRTDARTGQDVPLSDPLRAFAQAYLVDCVASALTFLTALSTVVAAAIAERTHRSRATTTTLVFALANLLAHTCHFLSLTACDLAQVANDIIYAPGLYREAPPPYSAEDYGRSAVPESNAAVAESVGRLCAVLAVAVSASYGSRRSLAEIVTSAPIHIGRAHQSTQALWKVIKDVWTSVHPDLTEERNLDDMKEKLEKLQTAGSTPNRVFIRRETQAKIQRLNRNLDDLAKALPRSDPGDHMKRRLLAEQGRIAARVSELRPVIDLSSSVRRLPVFISLRGKPGRGKSHLLGRLHQDMSKWMMEQGHLDRPMDRLVGTGGGDDYLPPVGNQEWYVVDEYLASLDDPWVAVINKTISDNPVTLSGAFVKNVEPHPHFVVTTSNIGIPFSFPQSSKNFMRREVLNAFHSRHNWVLFDKPNYDERLGRNDPKNHSLPFTLTWEKMVINDEGGPEVQAEEIEYQELLRRMQDQWTAANAKYMAAIAEIAVPEERAQPEAGLSNPRVISFLGATGQGKTWTIQNCILPILGAVMNVVQPPAGERPTKTEEPSVYVIDDLLTTQPDGWDWYRTFYDSLGGGDIVVIADNFQCKWRPKGSWLFNIIEHLYGAFTKTVPFSWRKLWEPRSFVPDASGLPHEALIRRIGLNGTCYYKGRLVSPATGSPDLCALVELAGMRDAFDYQHAYTEDEIMNHALGITRGSSRDLTRVARIAQPPSWDLDICIPGPADVMQYLTRPTQDHYVKVKPTLAAAFPDYRAILGHLTEELEPDLIFDALARAYRRKAYTARVRCGHRFFAVANGEVEGLGVQDGTDLRLEPTEGGVLLHHGTTTNLIGWEDFLRRTADLSALNAREMARYSVERNILLTTPIAQTRLLESQLAARRLELQARAMSAWDTTYAQMTKNKNLLFVIAALTVAVAGGGAIWLYLSHGRKNDEDTDKPESYEEASKKLPKKIVRAQVAQKKTPESYEEKTTRTPVAVNRKVALVKNVKQSPEAIDALGKPSAIHPMISVIREKVDHNLVWLTNGRVQCYGIGYRDNYIVCPAHILNGSATTVVEMLVGVQPQRFSATTRNVIPSRDVAILEKTGGPLFKDIRKHFPKATELPSHTAALQYIPKDDIMISKDLTFAKRMAYNLANAEFPDWKPNSMIYFAEHWTTPKLTARGDCGTPYISLNNRYDARRICGIHIAAGSEHSSYAASVAQEDLELATVEAATDPTSVEILGRQWIVPTNITSLDNGAEPGGYSSIEDTDRLKFIGYYQDLFSPSWTRGGDLKPSRISSRLDPGILENDQLPAPVSYRDPQIDPAEAKLLPIGKDGQPSLGAKQLGFISGNHTSLDPTIKARVIKAVTAMWLLVPGMTDWRPLSLDEALNGIDEPKWAGAVGAIRGDTSPGLPWKKFGLHKKSDLLERTSNDGERTRWSFAPTKHGRALATTIGETLSAWAGGHQYLRFVDCNLKVECLPKRKVKAANSRMFLAESMDAFLAQRVVCGFLQAIAMKTRWEKHQHHTTGINPYTEFQTMFARLTEISDHGFDADYSKFDKKIPMWAWEILEEVMVQVAKRSRYGQVAHYEDQIRQFVISLRDKFYIFEGNMFFASGDQASGVFPTNIGDSWLNDIIVVTVLTIIADQNPTHPVWKEVAPARTLNMERLANYVRWFTHGDDVVVAVHELLQNTTHFAAFRDVLKEHGMILTLPSKTSDDAKIVPLKDISFIGRTFEFDRDGATRPHGKLRKTAIARMLHWTKDGSWSALRENLEAAAREMRAYPEDEYTTLAREIERATADAGHPFVFPDWADARLDLIEERDGLSSTPVRLTLDARSYAEHPKNLTCFPEAKESCGTLEPIRVAGGSLETRSDLSVTGEGRGAPSGHCQAAAPAGNEYQRSTRLRIPAPVDVTCQRVEDVSPRANDLSTAAAGTSGRKPGPTKPMDTNTNNQTTTTNTTKNTKLQKQHEWRERAYESQEDFLLKSGLNELDSRFNRSEDTWTYANDRTTPYPLKVAIPTTPKEGSVQMTPAKAWSGLHYQRVHWLPSRVYEPIQCSACSTAPSGIVKFAQHARTAHPHLASLTCWPIPPVGVQCGEQHITLVGPQAVRMSTPRPTTVVAQPESTAMATDSLAAAQPGVDPATGAALNAAEQTNALASTGGIEVGIASTTMGSGVAAPVEEAITLVGPTLPPTIGAITGAQWSSYEVDRTAYEIVTDVNISASETPTGTVVARVPWGSFGPNMSARLVENRYMSGCTEVQAQFYGTTNTAGALLVYLATDVASPTETVSNILRRPHWVISAAAGTTTQAFLVHQTQEIVRARKTDFSDGELRPELRIVMYSPLVNTYGTDVQLNMKLLTRPGPDFRMWDPVPISEREVKITKQVLPAARYVVTDRIRGQGGYTRAPSTQLESPIGRKAYYRQSGELPNASELQGMYDEDGRSQYTGILNPLMASVNTSGPQDLTIFTGNLSSESTYQTGNDPEIMASNLLRTVGRVYNYGAVGTFSLTPTALSSGFAGFVASDIPDVTSSLCFEAREQHSAFGYETFTFPGNAERDAACKDLIWTDRARTATTGLNSHYHSFWTADMASLFFKDRNPAQVANDLTNFNINSWDDAHTEHYDILKKLHDDWGDSSWSLDVGNTTLGRVGLTIGNDGSPMLAMTGHFSVHSTDGEQIILHSPQVWNTNTSLERNNAEWSSLLVPANDEIRRHREAFLKAKPQWRPFPLQKIGGPKSAMNAYLEAAILGGVLGGIGGGISQAAQNDWWSKEFEKQRKFQAATGLVGKGVDAAITANQHKHDAAYGLVGKGVDAAIATKRMEAKAKYGLAGKGLDAAIASKQMDHAAKIQSEQAAVRMANNQELQSLRTQQSANSVGITTQAPPPAYSVTDPSPQAPTPQGPAQPPTGQPITTPKPIGANSTTPEQFHPSNQMQSPGELANPVTVSNAVNPYTEALKRV